MEKMLSEFAVGETGVIRNVFGEGKIRRRLFAMANQIEKKAACRKKERVQ